MLWEGWCSNPIERVKCTDIGLEEAKTEGEAKTKRPGKRSLAPTNWGEDTHGMYVFLNHQQ